MPGVALAGKPASAAGECERRFFEGVDLLVIYLNGRDFGGRQVICPMGEYP